MEYTGWCQNDFNIQGYPDRDGPVHLPRVQRLHGVRAGVVVEVIVPLEVLPPAAPGYRVPEVWSLVAGGAAIVRGYLWPQYECCAPTYAGVQRAHSRTTSSKPDGCALCAADGPALASSRRSLDVATAERAELSPRGRTEAR